MKAIPAPRTPNPAPTTCRQGHTGQHHAAQHRCWCLAGRQRAAPALLLPWQRPDPAQRQGQTDPLASPPACLQIWIEEMAGWLKSLDPNHLVTVGEEGFWGPGSPQAQNNPQPSSSEPGWGRGCALLLTCTWRVPAALLVRGSWLDAMHLLTCRAWAGAAAAGWAQATGQDFVPNHSIDSIDFAGIHIWPGG